MKREGKPTCSPHNDEANYVEQERGGRVRITCKVCGKFIGYKAPEKQQGKRGK